LFARNENKAFAATDKLKEAAGTTKVYFLKLDLGDLPSCAAAAKELLVKEPKIDIAFLNT
jgi:NAD(P)-dependent dehydrogenase (short-subunit alcohol dehydrogenase family)